MKLLSELLGTRYPLIQGGMANIATGEFAAACSNAGALGVIGSGGMNAEVLEQEIRKAKSLTDKPFGVNLMLMNPDTDRMAEVVIREKVPVVTTGAGNPGKYMAAFKAAGICVIPVAASVALAKRLIRSGADAIIAEGTESGGHVGEMTTMTLVPQMIEGLPEGTPVIAAGGIASGRQLAAVFALGACGAQIGTCLLVSSECPVHKNYKEAILKAKDNSTVVTGRSVDAPVRIIKNQMSRDYIRQERAGADRMELEKFTLGSLRKAVFDGNVREGSLMAGQVCGQINEIRPVKEILRTIWEEAGCVLQKLPEVSA
jgi:enoyl-[acyl-carrier protein] reductase II